VGLDLLKHRHGDREVIGAEQHLGRSLQPLSLECAPQQNRVRQAPVGTVQLRAGRGAGAVAELVGLDGRI
jgi:hypothetical protein